MREKKIIEPGKWHCEFDEDGNWTDVVYEISFRKMLGYCSDEDMPDTQDAWTCLLHPEDIDRVNDYLAECLVPDPDGKDFDIEYRMMTRYGYHWFHDYGHCIRREDGSVAFIDGVAFDIEELIEKENLHVVLQENNARIFALEDNFESLYDVDIETGQYVSYVKGDFYQHNVYDKLVARTDFFGDLKINIETVIYPDDREPLLNALRREALIKALNVSERINVYYRILTENGTIWCKIRAVYKDAKKKNIVIGVFNAQEEIEAKEKDARKVLLDYFVSSYESAYVVNLSDDSIEVLHMEPNLRTLYEGDLTERDGMYRFIDKKVHPDDRDMVRRMINKDYIKNRLKTEESFSFIMRESFDSVEKVKRVVIIRGADENQVAVGYLDITDEIREEQEQYAKKIEAARMIGALSADYGCVNYITVTEDPLSDLTVNYRTSRLLKKLIPGWENEVKFSVKMDLLMNNLVYGPDREQFYADSRRSRVVKELEKSDIYFANTRLLIEGQIRYYQLQFSAIREKGSIVGIVAGLHSIDEQMRKEIAVQQQLKASLAEAQEANTKLAEQSAFTRFFLEPFQSAYYVGLKDLSCQIYKRTAKLEADYPIITNYIDSLGDYINREVHPEDRDAFLALISPERMKALLSELPEFNFNYRILSDDGDRYSSFQVIRGADDEHAAFGFKDITDDVHKQQEQSVAMDLANQQRHIKAFGDMVNAALWSLDINDNDEVFKAFWSNEMRRMFGFEETEEDFPNTIEAWTSRIHPEDLQRTVDYFTSSMRNCDSDNYACDIEYRLMKKNGEYCWYHSVGRKEISDEGSTRLYGIIFDISADKKLEEQQKQLEEALSMAQSANRAKTTFLNNMSHDIRTPMNAIIGYTGLAASHIDNKEQVQNYLFKIGQSSNHLLSLINDVLDMSRIESGKMNLDEKYERLSDIIHTLRDIVQADVHSKKLDFFVDAVDVNDEEIICDKLRLNQVLLNILSNAIKYTPAGGTVIMHVTEKTIKPNGYATYVFCIKDNGMGMDSEFLKTIFDPFTRVKSSTVSGIQGTGLGMAITKNIIDMMGGEINIESEPQKGTTVTVTLDFMLQSAPKQPVEIPELKGLRGLVVDDDSNTCLSVCRMLEDIGMRDEWCTSGKEAVIRAKEAYRKGDNFKVYIIDWLMPDMNGIETARRIRAVIGEDTPIIILTAYDWSDIEDEARDAGVTAFVSKPMFPSDLQRVLNNCFGRFCEEIPEGKGIKDFSGKKVLLVEDNELNREIANDLLDELGFIIDIAEDGDVAIDRVKKAKDGDYDIILMDVQMPTIDGYEATRQIRALGTEVSRVPIIAMTANAFEEDRKAALEAGMNEHISKPINVSKFEETISKFL